MAKFTAVEASSSKILLKGKFNGKDIELTVGRDKHPMFFGAKDGFAIPLVKKGDEKEIPDEAISFNAESNRYSVSANLTLQQRLLIAQYRSALNSTVTTTP